MFEVNQNGAQINGAQGKYDKTVTNPSVRYGRNSVDNYYSYIEKPLVEDSMNTAPILDFGLNPDAAEKNEEKLNKFLKENDDYLKSLPPLEFEYRYMPKAPKGVVDKHAVLGAAYEELGKRKEVSVDEMDYNFAINKDFSTAPIDLNKDGKIDVGEYGSTILAADVLSKSDVPNPDDVDGTINQKGFNALLEYTKKSNALAATKLYSSLYNKYELGSAVKDFNPEA